MFLALAWSKLSFFFFYKQDILCKLVSFRDADGWIGLLSDTVRLVMTCLYSVC